MRLRVGRWETRGRGEVAAEVVSREQDMDSGASIVMTMRLKAALTKMAAVSVATTLVWFGGLEGSAVAEVLGLGMMSRGCTCVPSHCVPQRTWSSRMIGDSREHASVVGPRYAK